VITIAVQGDDAGAAKGHGNIEPDLHVPAPKPVSFGER
jgi:hypothetical protein